MVSTTSRSAQLIQLWPWTKVKLAENSRVNNGIYKVIYVSNNDPLVCCHTVDGCEIRITNWQILVTIKTLQIVGIIMGETVHLPTFATIHRGLFPGPDTPNTQWGNSSVSAQKSDSRYGLEQLCLGCIFIIFILK